MGRTFGGKDAYDKAVEKYNAANGGNWRLTMGSCAQGKVCEIYRGATSSSIGYGRLDYGSGEIYTLATKNSVKSVIATMAHEMIHYYGQMHEPIIKRRTELSFGVAQEDAINSYRGY